MARSKHVSPSHEDKFLTRKDSTQDDPREYKIPIILLVIGLICLFVSAFVLEGAAEAVGSVLGAFIILLVQIPLTILAMYILASLLGISYGNLFTAILKLAAISIFVEGLAFAGTLLGFPIMSRLILIMVMWALFSWLFDLDFWETFYSILGLGLISGAINWLITTLLHRAQGA
jgi:hypothetical protein